MLRLDLLLFSLDYIYEFTSQTKYQPPEIVSPEMFLRKYSENMLEIYRPMLKCVFSKVKCDFLVNLQPEGGSEICLPTELIVSDRDKGEEGFLETSN